MSEYSHSEFEGPYQRKPDEVEQRVGETVEVHHINGKTVKVHKQGGHVVRIEEE